MRRGQFLFLLGHGDPGGWSGSCYSSPQLRWQLESLQRRDGGGPVLWSLGLCFLYS